MHFLDDLSILSQDGQSKGIDLIDESGEDSHSSVLSQDSQSINLDGSEENGPSSLFQSFFYFYFVFNLKYPVFLISDILIAIPL